MGPTPPLRLVVDNPEFRHSANVASAQIMISTSPPTVTVEPSVWEQSPFQESQVNADGDEMASPTREELDAKLETIAAQTDTKVARLEGKMDLVLSKLDGVREDNRHLRNNVIGVGIALALLIIGVVAAAPVIFDLGFEVRETISKEIQERMPHS
jgi:hypothetical protein